MDNISIVLLCTLISTVVSVVSLQYQKTKAIRNAVEKDVQRSTTLQEELKYISKGIEDIKFDTRTLATLTSNLNDRVIRAEENIRMNAEHINEIKSKIERRS